MSTDPSPSLPQEKGHILGIVETAWKRGFKVQVPKFVLVQILLAILAVFPASAENKIDIHETELGRVQVEHVLGGLDHPWGLAMLPDGKLLVTERPGAMYMVDPENPTLDREVKGLPRVWVKGQGGLLDVAVDPDFAKNRTIYLTFSEPGPAGTAGTALASAQISPVGLPRLQNLKILYSMKLKTKNVIHFGSRVTVAPDGTLFVTVSDRGRRKRAQDPFDTAGSVLRVTKDGGIPSDNPFADGKNGSPLIWSIGHRSVQGAAIEPATGELWTLEHGAKGGDEVNRPEIGRNYGWPTISYGVNYDGTKIGEGTHKEGLEQPKHYWDPSIAPSGLAFYDGSEIPQWQGNLFVGALKFQLLSRLTIKDGEVVAEEQMFEGEYGRIRDVRSFPDGALWLITDSDEGEILRVTGDK